MSHGVLSLLYHSCGRFGGCVLDSATHHHHQNTNGNYGVYPCSSVQATRRIWAKVVLETRSASTHIFSFYSFFFFFFSFDCALVCSSPVIQDLQIQVVYVESNNWIMSYAQSFEVMGVCFVVSSLQFTVVKFWCLSSFIPGINITGGFRGSQTCMTITTVVL